MTTTKKPLMYVASQHHYAIPFLRTFEMTLSRNKADVILFTGGADVDPRFYDEERGSATYTNPERDKKEKELFDFALNEGKGILGICRGAQLACVMAGGKLAQHIEGHENGVHKITVDNQYNSSRMNHETEEEMYVNTLHHQMMIPFHIEHELIAWTSEKLSKVYLNGKDQPIPNIWKEPEIVWFPKIKALGIQCHPETMTHVSRAVMFCNQLAKAKFCG